MLNLAAEHRDDMRPSLAILIVLLFKVLLMLATQPENIALTKLSLQVQLLLRERFMIWFGSNEWRNVIKDFTRLEQASKLDKYSRSIRKSLRKSLVNY